MFSFFNVEVIELGMFVYCCILEFKSTNTYAGNIHFVFRCIARNIASI